MTCADGPCFNGGTCVEKSIVGGYVCRCPVNYHGSNCEKKIDRCTNNPCLNGGHCLDVGRNAICKCRQGFTGARCEINIDDCASNPCANGGTCVDSINTYTCSCTLGYGGKDCTQRVDACSSRPCLNGATCYTHFSGHVCQCPMGYMGSRCEFRVQEPTSASYYADPPSNVALAACLGVITFCLLACGLVLLMRSIKKGLKDQKGIVTNDLEHKNNLKEKEPFLISPPHFKMPNQDCLREKSRSKQKLLPTSDMEEDRDGRRTKTDSRNCNALGKHQDALCHSIYLLPGSSEQCVFATEV